MMNGAVQLCTGLLCVVGSEKSHTLDFPCLVLAVTSYKNKYQRPWHGMKLRLLIRDLDLLSK